MKATKSTSTALARVLALPLTAGLLAGCDYASKLPDAPSSLGYELQAQKPPSVTEPRAGAEQYGPPPPQVAALGPPPPGIGNGLDTQVLQVSPEGLEVPRSALAVPPSRTPLPPPSTGGGSFVTLDAAGRDQNGYTPPPDLMAGYDGPQLGVLAPQEEPLPGYTPVPFDAEPMFADAPTTVATQPVAIASLPGAPTYESSAYESSTSEVPSYETVAFDSQPFEPQPSTMLYSPEPLPYGTSLGQDVSVETVPYASAPQPMIQPQASPITVLHTRLDNGAVVSVHPVVGAPGGTSMALSRAIASELGASIDSSSLAFAPAVFDLRASASQGTGRAEAEWKLFSGSGALVGIFPESEASGSWTTMSDDALRAMARRVASRLRRNADLRRATLTSVASAPPITSIDYSAVLPSGAPSLAPMPQPHPSRMAALQPVANQPIAMAQLQPVTVQTTPFQPASLQAAPLETTPMQAVPAPQYVVNTQPLLAADPMANAIPRRRPEGVRTASLAPVTLPPPSAPPLAVAPLPPLQPLQAAPIQTTPMQAAPMQAAPTATAAAIPPPPSFDTLRATSQPADGPRALVFRGVRGAPGNGDEALGREVSRLLGQSGAQLSPNGTPNALYLTADVSRSRNGANDSIKIMWHVEEEDGTRVGQVVQENDVPAGALDANWGEDAFYAAQGARDGIMELLRTSGAIDA